MNESKKLTIEIELSGVEAEVLERFFEETCYDPGKFIKRLLLKAIERKRENDRLRMREDSPAVTGI
jgi:hypothetical protein